MASHRDEGSEAGGSARLSPAGEIAADEAQLPLGTTVGRYVVRSRIGRGGMGVVYEAYDPDLDRKVAIKLLAVSPEAAFNTRQKARLQREAQALAKLSHPHVVAVYDVGTFGDQVFVAMERVIGVTLGAWLGDKERSWQEVVGIFRQAGEGLAAAHAAGLMHRDFKPENVLVDPEGRAHVLDFGLAREAHRIDEEGGHPSPFDASKMLATADTGEAAPTEAIALAPTEAIALAPTAPIALADTVEAPGDVSGARLLSSPLTMTGTLIGTPLYMSPEQFLGHPTDARTDQFSFCVALYEGMYKQRPFRGETLMAIGLSVTRGEIVDPPKDSPVPERIRRAVLRGLRTAPADRFPSMEALLAELEVAPARTRGRMVLGALVLVLAGLAAFGLLRRAPAAEVCRGGEQKLAGVWDGPTKAKVREAFAGTGRSYAQDTYQRVEKALDERARAWVAMYTDSCEATNMRGEQSAQLLDLRTQCLDGRRAEMHALTAVLAGGPDVEVLDRSVQASLALTGLEGCADTAVLTAAVPPPADVKARADLEGLRTRIEELRALHTTGKYADGLKLAPALVEDAKNLHYPPVEAQALAVFAHLQDDGGQPKAAEATLRAAALVAAAAKDDAALAGIWIDPVYVVGYRQARYPEALALRPAAEAAVARAGGNALTTARMLRTIGSVLAGQGSYAEAQLLHERAVAMFENILGADDPDLAKALTGLGKVLWYLEKYAEAKNAYERALAIYEKTLGPTHPSIVGVLSDIGNAYNGQSKYAEALPYFERAVALAEKSLGPDHPDLAPPLNNLGNTLNWVGKFDEAVKCHERALALREKALGPEHPDVAKSIFNLGVVLDAQNKFAEAEPFYRRALAIREKALGSDHHDVARTLANLGHALAGQKKYDEALPYLDRAVAVEEKALGAESLAVATQLTLLAECYLEMGRPEKAIVPLERALSIEMAHADASSWWEVARTRYYAARALWESGRDRPRAHTLAVAARAAYAADGEPSKADLDDIDAWMRKHGMRIQ